MKWVSGINETTIAAGESGKIEIKHELGSKFRVVAFVIKYKSGLDNVEVQFDSPTSDKRFNFGRCQVCDIGTVKGERAGPPYQRLDAEIGKGSSLLLKVDNKTAGTIAEGDISVTVFGEFVGA